MAGLAPPKSGIAAGVVAVAMLLEFESPRAQQMVLDALPAAARPFVKIAAPLVALINARVIDGTGSPAVEAQTIVIRDGRIAQVGSAASVQVPKDSVRVDLTGKTVMPGLVMVHEHLYYPTGPTRATLPESFIRLYLAGGVTTMRTAASLNPLMDLKVKRLIDRGERVGPDIDVTGPYLNGPNPFAYMRELKNPADARKQVAYWSDEGATSFKAYTNIKKADLAAAIDEVHKRGLKITGHLCSITYAEAADLGIDNLEHGFYAATDFVAEKRPDACPDIQRSVAALIAEGPSGTRFKALVQKLVSRKVALTSTLAVLETLAQNRPVPEGLHVLVPELRQRFTDSYSRRPQLESAALYTKALPVFMEMERAFATSGGMLLAGTDSTANGGVIPGYANHRAIELLVEAGFSPVEAIRIATLNGAVYLRRDREAGTVASGKRADLVIVSGNPAAEITALRAVDTVFKSGVGFDPQKLIDSVSGQVGLW